MIFWYDSLYMDDSVRRKKEKCKRIIEKKVSRSKSPRNNFSWKNVLFGKNYYIIILANNTHNLFEIMNTNQMFFKYYEHTDVYVVGVSKDYEGAVEILRQIMTDGYRRDKEFDPRKVFTRDCFQAGDS